VRRPKDDIAFETLGAVDEAQVTIGVCRSLLEQEFGTDGADGGDRRGRLFGKAHRGDSGLPRLPARLNDELSRIQNDLLIAGGILSSSPGDVVPETMPTIGDAEIDILAGVFTYWRGRVHIAPRFFIAGDSRLGAEFDRARTVIRRAERQTVRLIRERGNTRQIPVSQYLNQLSDLCFVLARWADAETG
jgi:ATP:cob(I)alamin adenosyltransferase